MSSAEDYHSWHRARAEYTLDKLPVLPCFIFTYYLLSFSFFFLYFFVGSGGKMVTCTLVLHCHIMCYICGPPVYPFSPLIQFCYYLPYLLCLWASLHKGLWSPISIMSVQYITEFHNQALDEQSGWGQVVLSDRSLIMCTCQTELLWRGQTPAALAVFKCCCLLFFIL